MADFNLGMFGTLLNTFGYLQQGSAARQSGEQAKFAAEFNARQAEIEANASVAIAQRTALEQIRQGDYVASRALAVSAASGASASDPTTVRILSEARSEAVYRANVAFYDGESKARKLRLHALASEVGGDEALVEGLNRQVGYDLTATGALVKGISNQYAKQKMSDAMNLYSKYGRNGPLSESDIGYE